MIRLLQDEARLVDIINIGRTNARRPERQPVFSF